MCSAHLRMEPRELDPELISGSRQMLRGGSLSCADRGTAALRRHGCSTLCDNASNLEFLRGGPSLLLGSRPRAVGPLARGSTRAHTAHAIAPTSSNLRVSRRSGEVVTGLLNERRRGRRQRLPGPMPTAQHGDERSALSSPSTCSTRACGATVRGMIHCSAPCVHTRLDSDLLGLVRSGRHRRSPPRGQTSAIPWMAADRPQWLAWGVGSAAKGPSPLPVPEDIGDPRAARKHSVATNWTAPYAPLISCGSANAKRDTEPAQDPRVTWRSAGES